MLQELSKELNDVPTRVKVNFYLEKIIQYGKEVIRLAVDIK